MDISPLCRCGRQCDGMLDKQRLTLTFYIDHCYIANCMSTRSEARHNILVFKKTLAHNPTELNKRFIMHKEECSFGRHYFFYKYYNKYGR